jgi:ATP-binding protein involved in chromosome partitioning
VSQAAEELQIPFLGAVPLESGVREKSDEGTPIVLSRPESEAAKCLQHMTRLILEKMSEEVLR